MSEKKMSKWGRKESDRSERHLLKGCQHGSFSVNYSLYMDHPRTLAANRAQERSRPMKSMERDSHSSFSAGHSGDVYEAKPSLISLLLLSSICYAPTVIKNPLLSTTFGSFLLLLFLDFRSLRFDFTSSGERSVNCEHNRAIISHNFWKTQAGNNWPLPMICLEVLEERFYYESINLLSVGRRWARWRRMWRKEWVLYSRTKQLQRVNSNSVGIYHCGIVARRHPSKLEKLNYSIMKKNGRLEEAGFTVQVYSWTPSEKRRRPYINEQRIWSTGPRLVDNLPWSE